MAIDNAEVEAPPVQSREAPGGIRGWWNNWQQNREVKRQENAETERVMKEEGLQIKTSVGETLDNYRTLVANGGFRRRTEKQDEGTETYCRYIKNTEGRTGELIIQVVKGRPQDDPNRVYGYVAINPGVRYDKPRYDRTPRTVEYMSKKGHSGEDAAALAAYRYDGIFDYPVDYEETNEHWKPWMPALENLKKPPEPKLEARPAINRPALVTRESLDDLYDQLGKKTAKLLGATVLTGISTAASARAVQLTVQHLSHGETGKAIKTGLVAALGAGIGIYGGGQVKNAWDEGTPIQDKIERIESRNKK